MMLADLRREYHREICDQILFVDLNRVPNNADRHNVISVSLTKAIIQEFGFPLRQNSPSGQSRRSLLEKITASYIEKAFSLLRTLCPGSWRFEVRRKIDCVYHVALLEPERAAASLNNPAVTDMLEILLEGKRLRDISDLPFDLSV